MSSIFNSNNLAILKASGKDGSYLLVSIAFIVCRETSSAFARSPCDHPFVARKSLRVFFIDYRYLSQVTKRPKRPPIKTAKIENEIAASISWPTKFLEICALASGIQRIVSSRTINNIRLK